MGRDLTREQEMALLGILAGQLGERQRQMNGLNLDEEAVREDHASFLRLQREIAARAETPVTRPTRWRSARSWP